jgi:3-phosphoshikimate 1-carboxyvinyltransferase
MKIKATKNNLDGILSVPGSKSHTIRAVLIATMAKGVSHIYNPLASRDCLSSLVVSKAFGADVKKLENEWVVEGVGKDLKVPDNVIDCGNSGTTLYFTAAMAGTIKDGATVLTGDHQIRKRPIKILLDAMNALGGESFTTRNGSLACPAVIRGPIKPGTVTLNGRMSQYVSAIMLISPLLNGEMNILLEKPYEKPYLQMTVDWLEKQGITVDYDGENYRYFKIKGPQEYKAVNERIPSDWEGVAFPLVAALITDSKLVIEDLDLSGSQGDAVIVDILKEMGGNITVDKENNSLIAQGGNKLKGITIDCMDIPDAVPALSVAAAFAEGETKLTGIEMVRVKETDRVAVMQEELGKMGVKIEDDDSTMTIFGGSKLKGAEVDSHDDHRVAMALAVAGLAADGETVVKDAECCDVSFPDFYNIMNKVNANFEEV